MYYETNKLALYLEIVKYHGIKIWKFYPRTIPCVFDTTIKVSWSTFKLCIIKTIISQTTLSIAQSNIHDESLYISKKGWRVKNKFMIGRHVFRVGKNFLQLLDLVTLFGSWTSSYDEWVVKLAKLGRIY